MLASKLLSSGLWQLGLPVVLGSLLTCSLDSGFGCDLWKLRSSRAVGAGAASGLALVLLGCGSRQVESPVASWLPLTCSPASGFGGGSQKLDSPAVVKEREAGAAFSSASARGRRGIFSTILEEGVEGEGMLDRRGATFFFELCAAARLGLGGASGTADGSALEVGGGKAAFRHMRKKSSVLSGTVEVVNFGLGWGRRRCWALESDDMGSEQMTSCISVMLCEIWMSKIKHSPSGCEMEMK